MTGGNKGYHEYNPGFYTSPAPRGRRSPTGFGANRKPFCTCGEEFLEFAREHVPDLQDASQAELEQALLTLVREYAYRKQFVSPNHHWLQSCLTDIFDELVLLINGKLEELNRLPQTHGTTLPLLIGEDPSMPESEAD